MKSYLIPNRVEKLDLTFTGINSGQKIEDYLRQNIHKIVNLNITYTKNLFITSSVENPKHDLLQPQSVPNQPNLTFFYDCTPEGLDKINRYQGKALLGPIDCLQEELLLSGDPRNYRFNLTGGTAFIEGYFYVEFNAMNLGYRFYTLKAIPPSGIANYLIEHQ